jgi:hypothetical protein
MINLDSIKSHPYVSDKCSVKYYTSPFPHMVIDNFLREDIYESIVELFPKYIERVAGRSAGVVGENKELFYNANIYSIKQEDCVKGYEFFIDPIYKQYMSDVFGIETNQHSSCSAHYHAGSIESPSKNGWSHKDLSICSAIEDPSKEVKLITDCDYQDDTASLQPHTKKIARAIAMLYYLDNKDDVQEEDGGGTGLFNSYDFKDLVKKALPKNNRLFVFEISPMSYHSFIGANFNRSAIVQWFHTSPGNMLKKHLDKFKKQYSEQNKLIFERWKPSLEAWDVASDPDYKKHFGDISVHDLLNSK